MGEQIIKPQLGATCPALQNENYEYHLSGDCRKFCTCLLTGEGCKGRTIEDPEDRTSQFVSRGQCNINFEEIKKCPLYGASKETFISLVKDKAQKELDEKLKTIENSL